MKTHDSSHDDENDEDKHCPTLLDSDLAEWYDEEHPLRWLQPTPEDSAPLALPLRMWKSASLALHLPPSKAEESAESGPWHQEIPITPSTMVAESWPEWCSDIGHGGGGEATATESGSCYGPLSPSYASACNSPPPSPTAAGRVGMLVPSLLEAALGAWSEAEAREDGRLDFAAAPQGPEAGQAGSSTGLPSAGSAGHGSGTCKPCAFLYRPAGCSEAADCPFCHLCEKGEKKKRQKQIGEPVRQVRAARAREAAASASSAAAPVAPVPGLAAGRAASGSSGMKVRQRLPRIDSSSVLHENGLLHHQRPLAPCRLPEARVAWPFPDKLV